MDIALAMLNKVKKRLVFTRVFVIKRDGLPRQARDKRKSKQLTSKRRLVSILTHTDVISFLWLYGGSKKKRRFRAILY
jgi:hypothetical protein